MDLARGHVSRVVVPRSAQSRQKLSCASQYRAAGFTAAFGMMKSARDSTAGFAAAGRSELAVIEPALCESPPLSCPPLLRVIASPPNPHESPLGDDNKFAAIGSGIRC